MGEQNRKEIIAAADEFKATIEADDELDHRGKVLGVAAVTFITSAIVNLDRLADAAERINTPKASIEAADPVAVGQAFDRYTLLNVIELLKGRRSLQWDWESQAIRQGEITSGMMHGAAGDECDGIISTIEDKLREMGDASIQPPVPK